MGAGDWVTGGVRRAVSGVAALLPGTGAPQPDDSDAAPGIPKEDAAAEPSSVPEAVPGAAGAAGAEAGHPAESARPATETATRTSTPRRTAPSGPAPRKAAAEKPSASAPVEAPAQATAQVWSAEEVEGFRTALDAEIVRLREELDMGEADLADLVADSGDGSGDDQADAGSKTFEREHEMSVNANTRELIDQALRARARLDAGTYGICERCGTPIAIGRLRAYPRATLCIRCKQAEERR